MYEVLNSSWIHRILSETFKTVLPNIYLSSENYFNLSFLENMMRAQLPLMLF